MADARSGGRTFASADRPSTRGFLSEWYKTKHAFTASPGFQGAACNAVDNPGASPSTGTGTFQAGLPTMTTPVDVLIIGAGDSGAPVAWSLAETKMHILCLEQGDWMKPSEYPSAGRDWEARQLNDFHYSPNRRARDTDYPINDTNSPIKI